MPVPTLQLAPHCTLGTHLLRQRGAHSRSDPHILIIGEPEDGVAGVGVQLPAPLQAAAGSPGHQ